MSIERDRAEDDADRREPVYNGPVFNGDVTGAVFAWAATMAAAPFLQSVASHFGSRLAGAIDNGTRSALRRFLFRQIPEGGGAPVRSVVLTSEHGWSVTVRDDLPAEAIAQLLALHDADAPDIVIDDAMPARLTWDLGRWLLAGHSTSGVAIYRWDAQSNSWAEVS
ncbi:MULTISPECIES: hypothetical protein [unclassified Streptomyces]|uniref:hypothetical protein n=1 Tax=unclassified Streptomyces TaxID=2593676 RepID=UPI00131B014A|nr:hypothetical protein [Streptomyces sp. CB01635]